MKKIGLIMLATAFLAMPFSVQAQRTDIYNVANIKRYDAANQELPSFAWQEVPD